MEHDWTLDEALESYEKTRGGKERSDSTWRAHLGQLERWRDWVTARTFPGVLLGGIDEMLMRAYFDSMRPPAVEPSTYNNYRQYVATFWHYCREEGWVTRNPMRHVEPLKVPKKVRLSLSRIELLSMLEGADPRDRIGLAIGMNTALRGGDIAALKVGWVNLGNDTLTAWIEKTDEDLELPITRELHVELVRWFQAYATATGVDDWRAIPNDWTLVPPARGAAFNVHRPEEWRLAYKTHGQYRHPEQIVQRGLARLGLPTRKEGFHTLRRSAAREVYELAIERGVGDPIRIAQVLLNHKSRKTTEDYLGITHERRLRDEILRGQSFLARPGETVSQANDPGLRSVGDARRVVGHG